MGQVLANQSVSRTLLRLPLPRAEENAEGGGKRHSARAKQNVKRRLGARRRPRNQVSGAVRLS